MNIIIKIQVNNFCNFYNFLFDLKELIFIFKIIFQNYFLVKHLITFLMEIIILKFYSSLHY